MKSNLRPMNWKQKLNKIKAMTDDLENELKKIMKKLKTTRKYFSI